MNVTAKTDDYDLRGHTVLIIDDEPVNLGVLSDCLERRHCKVLSARTGASGLERARYALPELILLDVLMPAMDGFEVCRELKADAKTHDIPVIFMTVLASVEDKIKGFQVGGVDYITKPFQSEEVLARVMTHLQLRTLTVELQEANENLERRVEERTAELVQSNQALQRMIGERQRAEHRLSVQYAVTRILSEATTITQAAPQILPIICESFEWKVGEFWSIDQNTNRLRLVEMWGAPSLDIAEFKQYSQRITFGLGEGLPGQVWQTGQPVWIADIVRDLRFGRGALAKNMNLNTAFGFPIRLGDLVLGVMTFLNHKPRSREEDQLSMMSAVGSQIGQFIERKRAEEAVRESEKRFRALVENASDAIELINTEGTILYASPSISRILGYSVEEYVGRNAFDFVHPDDREITMKKMADLLAAPGNRVTAQARVQHKDGSWRWMDGGATNMLDEPSVRAIVANYRDITERKQAEEALRASEARLQVTIDAANIGLWDWDLVSGQIVWLGHHDRLFGFAPGEFDGAYSSFEKRVHPEDLQELNRVVQRARDDKSEYAHEYRIVLPDGTIRWIAGRGRSIYDETGQPVRMYGGVLDITKRKRAEEALRQSEYYLAEAQRISQTGSWAWDVATQELVHWSQEHFRMYGLDPGKVVPSWETAQQFIHPEDRPKILESINQAIRERTDCVLDYRAVLPDGTLKYIHSIGHPVVNASGDLVEFVGIEMDVTERKRAEEQIQREAARKDALLRVAHALNAQFDLDAVIRTICEETCQVMNVPIALVYFFDEKRDLFEIAGSVGVPAEVGTQLKPVPRAFYERHLTADGSLFVVPDAYNDPDQPNRQHVQALNGRSAVGASMSRDGHFIGNLTIATLGEARKFDNGELELLRGLADQAALAIQNARLFTSVREQREHQSVLSAQLVQAQETERRAIARELHDELGQILNAVGTNLQTIQLARRRSTRAERLQESINLVDDALRRTRDLALDLRPSMLDDFGLVPALEWYVDRQAQRSGFAAELVVEPPILTLLPSLETMCFRVAQIALTNVARHARAKHVRVELRRHETELELVVRDDGVGFDVEAAVERAVRGGTLGLLSMQERVRLAGGTLEIISTPRKGAEIRARFPLGQGEVHHESHSGLAGG